MNHKVFKLFSNLVLSNCRTGEMKEKRSEKRKTIEAGLYRIWGKLNRCRYFFNGELRTLPNTARLMHFVL